MEVNAIVVAEQGVNGSKERTCYSRKPAQGNGRNTADMDAPILFFGWTGLVVPIINSDVMAQRCHTGRQNVNDHFNTACPGRN